MRHQVPMVSLLLLVYLSAVAYISIEISLGSCWRRNIFRKLIKILNQQDPNFFLFVLLELWLVYHFPRFLQFFDVGAQKLMRRKMAQN